VDTGDRQLAFVVTGFTEGWGILGFQDWQF
jgi:hypothetical protein